MADRDIGDGSNVLVTLLPSQLRSAEVFSSLGIFVCSSVERLLLREETCCLNSRYVKNYVLFNCCNFFDWRESIHSTPCALVLCVRVRSFPFLAQAS